MHGKHVGASHPLARHEPTLRLGLPPRTREPLVASKAWYALSTLPVKLLSWLFVLVMLKVLAVCVNSYQPVLFWRSTCTQPVSSCSNTS